ncbi:Cupredoxin [Gigaspora margarita]|uniref:Cupredoxin n=1 Tax=Gigaspora margarita TaxID=4874 RepID=A0A8H4ABQ2_GIGMA|nr:Cupredoxin [Gigaspora margarita]
MSRFYLSFLAVFLVCLSVVSAATIEIKVGEGGLKFVDANHTVNKGDMILFTWVGTVNHSVMRSDAPAGSCMPATNLKGGANATISGPKMTGNASFVIDGLDQTIWYYCGVGQHCQNGMWGVLKLAGGSDTKASSANRISGGLSLGILMVVGAATFLF